MKKSIFASIFIVLLLANFASAYYFPSFRAASQDLVFTITDIFEPIFQVLFGYYGSGYIFETFLIFILIATMVFLSSGRVPLFADKSGVRWVITITVSLLSVRWIDYQWLVTIFDSYKLLGIVFSSILPFILYFFFLYNVAEEHGIIRKLGWALWIGIYVGLWSSSYVGDFTSNVYFWTLIAGVVCLVGDNFIQRRFRALEGIKKDEYFKAREAGRIKTEIQDLQRQITSGAMDSKMGRKMIEDLHKHLKWLSRQ